MENLQDSLGNARVKVAESNAAESCLSRFKP